MVYNNLDAESSIVRQKYQKVTGKFLYMYMKKYINIILAYE